MNDISPTETESFKKDPKEAKSEARSGGEWWFEKYIERWLANLIHVFLSVLALLTFICGDHRYVGHADH